MDGIDGTAKEPHSPHLPNQSRDEESKSVEGQIDFCVRRILQVYPNVSRHQLHSFIKNATDKNSHIIIGHALNAIRRGFISLEITGLGSSSNKRKHSADEEQYGGNGVNKRVKVDYANRVLPRRGPEYVELAVSQLHEDFSYVEERFIRAVFTSFRSLYAPTHLFLLAKQKEVLNRLNLKAVPAVPNLAKSGKGKRRALDDAEFDRERKWLLEVLANQEKEYVQVVADDEMSQDQIEVAGDDGGTIECGCCFAEYVVNDMASCPDKHLFCHGCISIHCSNLLLVKKSRIPCMSTEGCGSFFSASALRRVLDEKQFSVWERLDQRREIAAAGLILEDCPFCEFACVIYDDQATVFICGNTEKCGKESCRGCKKLNHLPRTCQEVRDDEVREGRHVIAEAMSRALMRNCPKCEQSFIKDDGCNKITCPSCGTLSCYICRKAIAGYEHFDSPGRRRVKKTSGKCPLFDAEADRHNDDVIQAATVALEQVQRDLPNVEQNELQVDLPPLPRQKPSPRRPLMRPRGRRLHPLPDNQPNQGILQQAAPLIAQAPQLDDQPSVPQMVQIGPPEAFGNPLPVLQQQQFTPALANIVLPQPRYIQPFPGEQNTAQAPSLPLCPVLQSPFVPPRLINDYQINLTTILPSPFAPAPPPPFQYHQIDLAAMPIVRDRLILTQSGNPDHRILPLGAENLYAHVRPVPTALADAVNPNPSHDPQYRNHFQALGSLVRGQ